MRRLAEALQLAAWLHYFEHSFMSPLQRNLMRETWDDIGGFIGELLLVQIC